MKAQETMVVWNRGGSVKAGPWPDVTGWSDGYNCSGGACWVWYQGKSCPTWYPESVWKKKNLEQEIVIDLMSLYIEMTAFHGVKPELALAELHQIEEFRNNVKGMEGWEVSSGREHQA